MKKERLFYLDFVRAFATVAIILTHYNALFLYNTSVPMPEKAIISITVGNVYIGNFGVSLFLIISGAALMYVYEDHFEIIDFYKKRFLNIFPMFWIAYVIAFLYNFYTQGGMSAPAPKFNIVFSILGIDSFLSNFSVPTWSTGVGEWFIGLIIMIYIIFPLLRKAVMNHPVISAVCVIAAYVVSVFTVGLEIGLFARLPEFVFGMYFVRYIKKINWKWAVASFIVLLYNTFLKPPIDPIIQSTYVGIFSFILLVYISDWIKMQGFRNICSVVCKYSYACFLVHHFIIYKVVAKFDLDSISTGNNYLLFTVCCCLIILGSYVLYQLHKMILGIRKTEKAN